MTSRKIISEIQLCESDVPNVNGTSLPNDLGTLITGPDTGMSAVSDRIALKLQEVGFVTGEFNRVFINLTSAIEKGATQLADRNYRDLLQRVRYFDVGVDFSEINSMDSEQRNAWCAETVLNVARWIAQNESENLLLIDKIEELHRELGEQMPIHWKSKSTKTYEVAISYNVAQRPNKCSAWVQHDDKKTQTRRFGKILDLETYSDLYYLASSITVKQGEIVLKPSSAKHSGVWTRKYQIPIAIPIDSLELA